MGCIVVVFWLPFGPCGSLLAPLWLRLAPSGVFWAPFVFSGRPFRSSLLSFGVFGLAFSHFLCYGASFLRISVHILSAWGAAGCRARDVDPPPPACSGTRRLKSFLLTLADSSRLQKPPEHPKLDFDVILGCLLPLIFDAFSRNTETS